MARRAAWPFIRTRFSCRQPTRDCTRSTRGPARSCGRPPSPNRRKDTANTGGPLVIHGKVLQGLMGCGQFKDRGLLHQRLRRRDGKQLWKFQTVAREGEPGGDTWGKLPNLLRGGRRHLDHRQLRSRTQSDLLGRRAGQALDARQPRREARRQGAVHQLHAGAESGHRQARLVFPARPRRIAGSRRSVRARAGGHAADRSCCSPSARPASCGSSTARPASFSAFKETVFQNVFARIDPKTGEPTYRSDILEQQIGQVAAGVSEHRRRPQLAGHELSSRRPVS